LSSEDKEMSGLVSPFPKPDLRTSFESHRVALEVTDARVGEERLQPRQCLSVTPSIRRVIGS
jgi:hypothetical protein